MSSRPVSITTISVLALAIGCATPIDPATSSDLELGAEDPSIDLEARPSESAEEDAALAANGGVPDAPRVAKSTKLYVVRMGTGDFKKSYDDAIVAFQGLVNRGRKAKLYLIRDQPSDDHWLSVITREKIFASVTELPDLAALFAVPEFATVARRMVVHSATDLDAKLGFNNAVMIAALKDAIVVEESHRTVFESFGFTVAVDLVGKWRVAAEATEAEKNANELRAFRYAATKLQPRMSKGLLGISPGNFGRSKGLDYFVKHRYFVMHLDAKQTAVQGHGEDQKKLLKKYPAGTVALGTWTNEVPDVRLLSEVGHTRIGEGYNVSVHESLALPNATPRAVEGRDLSKGSTKDVFVLLSFTQGDALGFCAKDNLRSLDTVFRKDAGPSLDGVVFKEKYAFGLQHSPVQWGFQRLVIQGLHQQATPMQEFMAKPYGYSKSTTLERAGFLDLHLERGKKLLAKSGIQDAFLNDGLLYQDPGVVEKYARILKPRSVFTKHSIFKDRCINREASLVRGVPFFSDPIVVKTESKEPEKRDAERRKGADAIVESSRHRRFFWVFIDHTGSANDFAVIQDYARAKNPRIRFVGISDLVATFLASPEAKMPGNDATFKCIPEKNPAAFEEGEE
jgi:hypothetical protein